MPSGFIYDIVNFRKKLYICYVLENEKTLSGKRVRTIFLTDCLQEYWIMRSFSEIMSYF